MINFVLEKGYSITIKLTFLVVIAFLLQIFFNSYLPFFTPVSQWWLSIVYYPNVTYEMAFYLYDLFIFFLTYKIAAWLFDFAPHDISSHEYNSAQFIENSIKRNKRYNFDRKIGKAMQQPIKHTRF